jgi:hypothetical protein
MERNVEDWSLRDEDRPYVRPERSFSTWPLALLAALAVGVGAIYYYYLSEHRAQPAPVAAAVPTPQAAIAPASQSERQEPTIRHRIEVPPVEVPKLLPPLEKSDAMMRDSVVDLIGGSAFAHIVVPDQLIRRIVATIDNLPRQTAARRLMPLNSVPGAFVTAGANESLAIAPANFARYAPYVRVLEMVNTRALVYSYARAYSLFQRAYEELGYPGKYFNDRLIEAIDDLLDAPEIDGRIELMRPKVLYEFADPDLETRSAGQKIMVRMGKENALRVKAKLGEIREALVSLGRAAH